MRLALVVGILIVVALVVATVLWRGRTGAQRPVAGANPFADLRARALAIDPRDLGLSPAGDEVWGVLMDLGLEQGTATVACFADGNASLYLSSGGGMIGGGRHESVNNAARAFVIVAGQLADSLVATPEPPLPGAGRVRFTVHRGAALMGGEFAEAELAAGHHRLSPLYAAGQQVITQLRLVSGN